MSIKKITSDSDINGFIDKQIKEKEAQIIRVFDYLGLMCVNEARSQKSYIDRTGNLRNSIGYVVVNNGVVVSGGGFEGDEGKLRGEAFAKRKVASFRRGLVLMVVAGMQYAGYVEAMGLDVLTSSELFAESQLPKMMKRLGFQVR